MNRREKIPKMTSVSTESAKTVKTFIDEIPRKKTQETTPHPSFHYIHIFKTVYNNPRLNLKPVNGGGIGVSEA